MSVLVFGVGACGISVGVSVGVWYLVLVLVVVVGPCRRHRTGVGVWCLVSVFGIWC